MKFKILTNGQWTGMFTGTEKQAQKHVDYLTKHHSKDGMNRQFTYEAK